MDYYSKYIKYKTKYMELKQKGGLGSSSSFYWNQHPSFEKINMNNLKKVILHNEYKDISSTPVREGASKSSTQAKAAAASRK